MTPNRLLGVRNDSNAAPRRTSTRYAGVYKSVSGSYEISYSDSAGKRVFKTMPKDMKIKEAVQYRADLLGRMSRGERIVSSKMTVAELIEEYLKTQTSHLAPKTYQAYAYSLDHYVTPSLGSHKVTKLKTRDLANFISDMRRKGYKAWTIRGCLSPISRMFAYAVREGYMARNLVRDLDKAERPKSDQRKMEVLNTEEIEKLLSASQGLYRVLFAAAIFTGLRISECLALEWEDVDLLGRTLYVRKSKTDAGVRSVVLTDFLIELLNSLESQEGLVFPSKAVDYMGNPKPLDQANVRRELRASIKRAGIKHVSFHELRHTYASVLISQGWDLVTVAGQLGHTNGEFTARIYGHVFDAEKKNKEIRERMDAAFSSIVTPMVQSPVHPILNGSGEE